MSKKLSIVGLLFLLSVNANAQKNKPSTAFNAQIDVIMAAFKIKKTDKLLPLLLPNYTIKGIPKGVEPLALAQIFEQMPTFSHYAVKSVKAEKENQRVTVSFILKEEKLEANLLFDKQKKIRELNILEGAEVN